MAEKEYKSDLRVINIGTTLFYDALVAQGVKATQLDWKPPVKQSAEVLNALNAISSPELKAKIDAANEVAVGRLCVGVFVSTCLLGVEIICLTIEIP